MVTFKTIGKILDDFDNLKSNNKHIFIRGVGPSFMQTILETTVPKCEKDTYIADMKTVKLSTDVVTVKTLVKILTKTQALNSKFAFQTKDGECLYVYDITPGVGDVIELHVGSYLYDANGNKVTTVYKDFNNKYVAVDDDTVHTVEKDITLIEYLSSDEFAGSTLVNVKKYLMDIRTPQHLYKIIKQRPELINYMNIVGNCYDVAITTTLKLDAVIIEDNELFILLRDKYSYVSHDQSNFIKNVCDYNPKVIMELMSNVHYLESILTNWDSSDLVKFLIMDQKGAYISRHKEILVYNLIKAIKTLIGYDNVHVKTLLRDFINDNLPYEMLIDLKYTIERSYELYGKVNYLNISF